MSLSAHSEPTPDAGDAESAPRALSWKSVGFGLLGCLFVSIAIGWNDEYLKQSSLAGHQFPLVPFGGLLLFALVWNPLCSRLWPAMRMRAGELAVFLAMTLAGSWVAGASFTRHFFKQIMLPWHHGEGNLSWERYGLLEHLPAWMSPVGRSVDHPAHERVYGSFASGLGPDQAIPWEAWWPTLLAWSPLIAVFAVGVIAMAVVVHRQWSRHEQLAYPLAQVGQLLIARPATGSRLPPVFTSTAFRLGIGLVLTVQMLRLIHVWFPAAMPDIRLGTGFTFLWQIVPHANQAGLQMIQAFKFFFLIVGISYFVASEISLTFGLAQFLLCALGIQVYLVTGRPINTGADMSGMRAGAYLCYALAILFIGRHYYWALLRRALGLGPPNADNTDRDGSWAARVLLVSGLLGHQLLVHMVGLDALVALCFMLVLGGMMLVFSRIICETGIPYMQALWSPGLIIGQLTGPIFLGPSALVLVYYMSTIAMPDVSCSLMPYLGNALKVAEGKRLRPLLVAGVALLAIVVSIGGATFGRLQLFYTYGAIGAYSHGYSSKTVPRQPFDRAVLDHIDMQERGVLAEDADGDLLLDEAGRPRMARDRGLIERLADLDVDRRTLIFFLAGAFGVALFFFCRLRFTWFPLHPVLFLVWGAYPMWLTAWAWLIGWAAKRLIVGFGGGRGYEQWKPFFVGFIVGDLAASLIGLIIGGIHFLITGNTPPAFITLPT